MAIKTVALTDAKPSYSDYANDLSWDLNELSFRAQAALEVLHGDESGIDADRDAGLALSYLLRGIAKRAEELALASANTELDYVLSHRAARGAQSGAMQ